MNIKPELSHAKYTNVEHPFMGFSLGWVFVSDRLLDPSGKKNVKCLF